MNRGTILVTLLVAAALAGCIGDSGEQLDMQGADDLNETAEVAAPLGLLDDGTPVPTTLAFEACNEVFALFPVPMDFASQEVPEGFEVVPFSDAGVFASLAAISYTCATDDGEVSELYGAIQVEPPEELAHADDGAFHAVLIGALTTSELLESIYDAWSLGATIEAGEVTIATNGMAPARHGEVMASAEDFDLAIETVAAGPEATQDPGMARWFSVDGGEVVGAMDVSWNASRQISDGVATFLSLPPGMVPPAMAGLTMHNWGEDYTIWYEYVDVDAAMDDAPSPQGLAPPSTGAAGELLRS